MRITPTPCPGSNTTGVRTCASAWPGRAAGDRCFSTRIWTWCRLARTGASVRPARGSRSVCTGAAPATPKGRWRRFTRRCWPLKRLGLQLRGDVLAHLVVEEEVGGNGTLAMVRRGEKGGRLHRDGAHRAAHSHLGARRGLVPGDLHRAGPGTAAAPAIRSAR